ncbi:C39 family peptidase [Barrientosiimonas marina]|uniref:C39 family peptidase n=1 Tax=Lentibacillus kimchii TaxID=1542911 RepID=A0ABW2UUJ2_9BACI
MSLKRLAAYTGLAGIFWLLGRRRVQAPGKTTVITGVPAYKQYPELPTGCEAASLAMLLSWGHGEPVTTYTAADSLKQGDKVHMADGQLKGAHPNQAFVGDPYTDSEDGSYGVFEGPVLEALETFMPGRGADLSGKPFTALIDIIRSGRPVLAWTTLAQRDTYYGLSWTAPDGQVIDWYENEHAVVLIGIDAEHVICHDPHTGEAEFYDRQRFVRNWQSMGRRAITLTDKAGH